jgi:hypothetical protein
MISYWANFNDTKINFTDCNATMYTTTSGKFNATDTNNTAIKPYRIFGLKGIE